MCYVVPTGPWTDPLNLDLHATFLGEPLIPFRFYVQPRLAHRKSDTFEQFTRLPLELQYRVFRFCDSSTLFQLMHVSSTTRNEAKKLFWSSPEIWYTIEGPWLAEGGFPVDTLVSLDALTCMKYIDVDFAYGDPLDYREFRKPKDLPSDDNEDHRIHRFWKTLQNRLPSATDVVLSHSGANLGTFCENGIRAKLMRIAERCPIGISTSISWLRDEEHRFRLTRVLCKQTCSQFGPNKKWDVVDSSWSRQTVLPPPKRFCGPVGAYSRTQYLWECSERQSNASRLLRIQAVEAYHIENPEEPRICRTPGCEFRFELPGQWAKHSIEARHREDDIVLPSEHLDKLFKDHEEKIEHIGKQGYHARSSIHKEWDDSITDIKKRIKIVDAYQHQIQTDPLYASNKPPVDNFIWITYFENMEKNDIWPFM